MNVANNVERTVLRSPVVPKRLSLDACGRDILVRPEDEDVPEPFTA
jgi:hypothetical protein